MYISAQIVLITALVGRLAQADKFRRFGVSSTSALHRRQAFDPPEEYGYGDTCVDAFGTGYVQCVPETELESKLCVNPDLGESCCDNLWGCPALSFCLVQNLCCPDGLTPQECGLENSVDVPDDFTPTTATAIPETTSSTEEEELITSVTEESPTFTSEPDENGGAEDDSPLDPTTTDGDSDGLSSVPDSTVEPDPIVNDPGVTAGVAKHRGVGSAILATICLLAMLV